MDLFWRDTLTCPSEEDYLEMVGNKTGGLFRLAVKLMQAESTSNKSVGSPSQPAELCSDLRLVVLGTVYLLSTCSA